MLWLNILCKWCGVICDEIYIYKHGTFNKRQQNFNKNMKIRKTMECSVIKLEAKHFMLFH